MAYNDTDPDYSRYTEEAGNDAGGAAQQAAGEEDGQVERQPNFLERFFSRNIGDGKLSWGLIFLFAFAVYAIVELIMSILYFF